MGEQRAEQARYLLQHGLRDGLQLCIWVVQQRSTELGEAHTAALHRSLGQSSIRPLHPDGCTHQPHHGPQKPLCRGQGEGNKT